MLQLIFCCHEGVWWWVEFIGFEALIRESHLEWFVILLETHRPFSR